MATTTTTKLTAKQLIGEAKADVVLDHVFFSQLLLQTPIIEDPSIPTACIDGTDIRYNPVFIESQFCGTREKTAGLLIHEVLHPALGHLWRIPCDPTGNMAGDYAINNWLDDYNKKGDIGSDGKPCPRKRKVILPDGGLIDHKYDNMSVEEIDAALRKNQKPPPPPPRKPPTGGKGPCTKPDPNGTMQEPGDEPQDKDGGQGQQPQGGGQQPPQDGQGGGQGQPDQQQRTAAEGGWGEFTKPKASKELSPEEVQQEWQRRVVQAATACKMYGNLPGCIEAIIKDLIDPKVPWQDVLNKWVDETTMNDYSFRVPDRRFLPQGIVIPDLYDETLGTLVVAIDTSGSIFCDTEALATFEGELNGIIERVRPNRVHVLYCDTRVTHADEFTDQQPVKLIPRGGGGTAFEPVGEWIEEHNLNPRVCIYLTDLYGSFPAQEWPFPTIWCVYGDNRQRAPFGEMVYID